MKYHFIGRTEHFAVGHDNLGKVLVELGDPSGEQILIALDSDQAKILSNLILENIEKAESDKLTPEDFSNIGC